MKRQPVLVIHGGTGERPDSRRIAQIRRALRTVAREAYAYLSEHAAVEAAAFTVQRLEDAPLFNAGTGAALQRDGRARMSASIMDGVQRRFAAVLNIERVRHPVLVARALLEEDDRVLAGPEALRFARAAGFPSWDPITAARRRQWRRWPHRCAGYGTVGAVALDLDGRLATATSTGGKPWARPGRVSDSGQPVGNYANPMAAVSCTGIGEEIVEEGLAVRIAQRCADGLLLARAFTRTFRELAACGRRAGAIGLDVHGRVAWATTLPVLFAVAWTRRGRMESF